MPVEWKIKKVECTKKAEGHFPVLGLEMKDAKGVEYHDGDIVKTSFLIDGLRYPMIGFIRYFGGRFEVVCNWQDQRFVLGLNPTHEIIGHVHIEADWQMIEDQYRKKFKKEGGLK